MKAGTGQRQHRQTLQAQGSQAQHLHDLPEQLAHVDAVTTIVPVLLSVFTDSTLGDSLNLSAIAFSQLSSIIELHNKVYSLLGDEASLDIF